MATVELIIGRDAVEILILWVTQARDKIEVVILELARCRDGKDTEANSLIGSRGNGTNTGGRCKAGSEAAAFYRPSKAGSKPEPTYAEINGGH